MSAWGANAKSCKSLLDRVERNDPALTELFILPTKNFGGPEVERLADIFEQGKNTNLKVLRASGHKVPNEALFLLGKAIANAASKDQMTISSLSIGDNSMGDDGIVEFCKGVEAGGGKTSLEIIDLSWKGIGKTGFGVILETFSTEKCPKLHTINLSRNEGIGQEASDGATAAIANYSIATISHAKEIDLSQCQLQGDFVKSLLDPLTCKDTGKALTEVKKFSIQENPLGDQGFNALLTLIATSAIEDLDTSKCEISDQAIQSLPTGDIEFANNLRSWNLSGNSITERGISHLAESLISAPSMSKLVELNLAGNQLGEDGVKMLATALAARHDHVSTSALSSLDLTNTMCGVGGAADVIQKGKLRILHLFNNNIGSEGFRYLSVTLQGGHSNLEYLDLGGNGADQASVVVLLNALLAASELNVTSKLKVLVVGGNESGEAVEQIAKKVEAVHPTLKIARDKKTNRQ